MPETWTIPIIALTAFSMTSDRQKCLAAGCDEYESKPIIFERLLAKIQALLN
jgi:CheY-like chemotaxis protein